MNNSYLIGVIAAVAAGVTFNLGMVAQKVAVMRLPTEAGLMHQLVRNPLWMAGFALQFLVGMPLNLLAQAKIGPALLPGLMAAGLIVLAIGAVRLAGESLSLADVAGILLIIAAITFFGLSQLAVDMQAIDLWQPAFLLRLAIFTLIVAGLSVACHLAQRTAPRMRGVLRTLDAGLLYAQSNLWLGVLMGLIARWGTGQLTARDLLLAGIATGIVSAGSMLGIVETQRAFQVGEATKLVPIQNVPGQILPIIAYFAVFALNPSTPAALPLAALGILLVLAGAALLARRQTALN